MDDALQEVAVKAARALPTLRDPNAVGAWLSRTTYRTCVDLLHRRRGLVLLAPEDLPEPDASGADFVDELGARDAVTRLLATLTPEQRLAVVLVDQEGLDYHLAAEILGISSGTIGSRLSKARAVLRRAVIASGLKERSDNSARRRGGPPSRHGRARPRPGLLGRGALDDGAAAGQAPAASTVGAAPYQVGVAAAAAAAVVAVVLIGLPSRNGGSPTPANAAQLMLSAMDNGLLNTTTVRGDFSEITTVDAPGHAPAWAEWRGSFAADAAGDSRYEIAFAGRSAGVGVVSRTTRAGPAVPSSDRPNAIWAVLPPARYVSLYDAGAMAVRWAAWNSNGKLVDHGSARRWPTFLWEPAPDDLLQFWVNNLGQAALVQAAVAGTANLPVRAVTYEGRPAWQATIDLRPWYRKAAYFRVLREVVTVDQASGFIVRTVLSATPGPASKTPGFPYALSPYTIELRITHLKTGSTLPAGAFTELPEGVPNPAPYGASVKPSGTPPLTSGTLAQAAASAGFRPLTPDPLPAGFVFSAASSNAHMGIGSMISQFAVSPREVDQLYRRGFRCSSWMSAPGTAKPGAGGPGSGSTERGAAAVQAGCCRAARRLAGGRHSLPVSGVFLRGRSPSGSQITACCRWRSPRLWSSTARATASTCPATSRARSCSRSRTRCMPPGHSRRLPTPTRPRAPLRCRARSLTRELTTVPVLCWLCPSGSRSEPCETRHHPPALSGCDVA